MMRSMFAGVSGLRTHQTMMDVVGNNIANVNTAGFKASQVTFAESLSQVLRGASGETNGRAGINPAQIGLGVKVAQIEGIFTQGASQVTGRNTDLAIQGDGFFVTEAAGERTFTRLGSFTFDESGNLSSSAGGFVQGWVADATGAVDTNLTISNIQIPLGQVVDPQQTTQVDIGGSLSSDALVGDVATTSIEVFDSLGEAHEATYTFTKTGVNQWDAAVSIDGTPATLTPASLTFDTTGQLTSPSILTISGFTPPGADPLSFVVDLGTSLPIVQFGGESTMEAKAKDGQAIGYLVGYSIGDDGLIEGQFSNGQNKSLGQVATATFANPAGLVRESDSTFRPSVNSGEALIGTAGSGNRGLMSSGTLEMSNVDLSREFTNLIIAQRGFQANSRVITTTDELLADLVNIKR